MLKHKRMNVQVSSCPSPKKDDLKGVAKEETMGMPVKRKEAKKNQEMDEAVDKKDSVEVGKDDKKPGKMDAEEDQDARIKSEDKKSGEKIFDEAIKIAHAEIAKKNETEGSGSGPARASSVGKENFNNGGKKAETDVKKISKEDGRGGEKVDGEEEQKAMAEAKEDGEEAARRIQGLEPPQDDMEEELKVLKEGTSDKQDKEVSTNKLGKDEVPEEKKKESLKKESLKKDSTDKKDSLEKISADKKDSDVEKDPTLEKVLEELDPTKDEKCCGFVGIEPVGGRYCTDPLLRGLLFFCQVVPLLLRHQVEVQGLWQAHAKGLGGQEGIG